MRKITSTRNFAIKIDFATLKIFGQNILNAANKKQSSKEWSPLLDVTLSQWEMWTGVPEPLVKNLPPSYKKRDKKKQNSDMN